MRSAKPFAHTTSKHQLLTRPQRVLYYLHMQKRWGYYLLSFTTIMVLTGAGCGKGATPAATAAAKPLTLEYWSVAHDSKIMGDLTTKYKTVRSYVTIKFRRYRPEEFEQKLLEALAEDRGPDVITIHNTWVGKYQSKLAPMPANLTVARVYTKGGKLRSEQVIEIQNIVTPTIRQLDERFVQTVKADVVRNDGAGKPQIWGLPMALDTMVLFYNQDLLDQANIPQAPTTWTELQEAVVATTRYDNDGGIVQAGGAFGTGKNVDRAGDILTALLMQNGATMSDARGRATFNLIPEGVRGKDSPALEALRFYTDFGNPGKQGYTWNTAMESSLDAFSRGKAAFFFGYAYHIPLLKARAPKLNYRILSMPQLNPAKSENVANYWIESVSKKTAHPNEAWDFVNFLTQAQQADYYTERARKPTALRASIDKQLQNPDLTPFASQVTTAKSWYHGRNPAAADTALVDMIDFIHENRALEETEDIFTTAIERAISKINQSL